MKIITYLLLYNNKNGSIYIYCIYNQELYNF